MKVNDKIGYSPEKKTRKFHESEDKKRLQKVQEIKTVELKKKELYIKKNGSTNVAKNKKNEGIIYGTNYGFSDVSKLICNQVNNDGLFDPEKCKVVIFSLGATELSPKNAELYQIAAYYEGQSFNVYTIPSKGIPKRVSTITNLIMLKGEMFCGEKKLTTVSISEALIQFINFLSSINSDIILVAHNGFKYDTPLILRQMMNQELLDRFKYVVKGFADSLIILREQMVERIEAKRSFKQTVLAADFLDPSDTIDTHNAVNDVHTLYKLLQILTVTDEFIKINAKSTIDMVKNRLRHYLNHEDFCMKLFGGLLAEV